MRRFKTLAAKLLLGVVIAFVVPIGWSATVGRGDETTPEVVSAPVVPAERVIRLAKARAALARLYEELRASLLTRGTPEMVPSERLWAATRDARDDVFAYLSFPTLTEVNARRFEELQALLRDAERIARLPRTSGERRAVDAELAIFAARTRALSFALEQPPSSTATGDPQTLARLGHLERIQRAVIDLDARLANYLYAEDSLRPALGKDVDAAIEALQDAFRLYPQLPRATEREVGLLKTLRNVIATAGQVRALRDGPAPNWEPVATQTYERDVIPAVKLAVHGLQLETAATLEPAPTADWLPTAGAIGGALLLGAAGLAWRRRRRGAADMFTPISELATELTGTAAAPIRSR